MRSIHLSQRRGQRFIAENALYPGPHPPLRSVRRAWSAASQCTADRASRPPACAGNRRTRQPGPTPTASTRQNPPASPPPDRKRHPPAPQVPPQKPRQTLWLPGSGASMRWQPAMATRQDSPVIFPPFLQINIEKCIQFSVNKVHQFSANNVDITPQVAWALTKRQRHGPRATVANSVKHR